MADDPSVRSVPREASTSPLAPFRHDVFRAVWFASLASNFGGLIQSVGASWMMASISDSADMVALVQASTALPIMLFSLPAGAIADNYDRRGVMLVAQIFLCVVSVLLTAAAYLGFVTPWLLLTFTFFIGCGTALNGPAVASSVGKMVPRHDLPAAIALNSMGFNIARSVGPAVGGAIVAIAGAASAFAVNAISYLGLIVVLFRGIRNVFREHCHRKPSAMRWAQASAMSACHRRSVRCCCAASCSVSLQVRCRPSCLIARDLIHGGPLTFGVLLGAFGFGAVGGALLSTRVRGLLSVEMMVRGVFGGFAVCAAITALSPIPSLTVVAMTLGGACWVLGMSTFNVAVQLSAPRWVVGRALALYQMAAFGGIAVGSGIWGALAERLGSSDALLISAGVHALGIAIGFIFSLPDMQELIFTRSAAGPSRRSPSTSRREAGRS